MLKHFFQGKIILVVGAAGSIGSALCRRIVKQGPKLLILLDQDESSLFQLYLELKEYGPIDYVIEDIRDRRQIMEVLEKYRPYFVFHAAAYKNVLPMEKFPYQAWRTNVYGTRNIVDASLEYGVKKFIFISTDKAVEPNCQMGKTKAEGEKICLRANQKDTKFIIVRFGNVMPSRGSVVPIFQKQISEGKDLTVTDVKMKRYFMGIYEAVELIFEAARLGKGGEIFVLDMGEQISIDSLAKMMIKLSGKDLKVIYTGVNKAEKFEEKLMTREEKKVAKKIGNLYVIKKDHPKEKCCSGRNNCYCEWA